MNRIKNMKQRAAPDLRKVLLIVKMLNFSDGFLTNYLLSATSGPDSENQK